AKANNAAAAIVTAAIFFIIFICIPLKLRCWNFSFVFHRKHLQETQRIDLLKLYKQNFFKSSFFVTFNIESCCCVSAGEGRRA
ncbi:hypothetical protein, partial [uncultured Treponema sp.]|uniref:hypothetical protein n=1 Tax=uncultured Treponema sp. TaxID=162155 RepID=UPI002595FA5E